MMHTERVAFDGFAVRAYVARHARGGGRWWPFIRSLKMHVLSKKVVRELDGTYALELDRFHGESAEAALDFVNKELCRMHKPKACNFGRTRKDLRWALGVVRRGNSWIACACLWFVCFLSPPTVG